MSVALLVGTVIAMSSTGTGRKKTESATIFVTGNELGALKPCGCASGQLGGLEKRPAVFGSVPEGRRLIIDTGRLTGGSGSQDLIKFGILMQAFGLLGYDVAVLQAEDMALAEQLGLPDPSQDRPAVIASAFTESGTFSKSLRLAQRNITVVVTAIGGDYAADAPPSLDLSDDPNRLDIVVLGSSDPAVVEKVASIGADCVVRPPQSDEPIIESGPGVKPLVFSPGRFGGYICKLQIIGGRNGDLRISVKAIPMTEDLPSDPMMVELYRIYQQTVRDDGLLLTVPKAATEGNVAYMGSASCKDCHDYEYEKWSTKAHAHAYATLEKVGSQYDPECISCHVVGYEYVSGFVSETDTPSLKDVGCESCHGPGSEHIKSLGGMPPGQPRRACMDCHTPDHSHYMGNEKEYFRKIIHWREHEGR